MKVQATFESNINNFFDYVQVKVNNEDGVQLDESHMTLDEFISCVMGATYLKETLNSELKTLSSSPILPSNCLHFKEMTDSERRFYYLTVSVPKRRWDIMVYNTIFLDVGFPHLVFQYKVDADNKAIISTTIYALKSGDAISARTALFKFPFSNVSQGRICLGVNKMPEINEVSELGDLHTKFLFNSPFSDDYYVERNLSGAANIRELGQLLTNQDFPDDWLIPINKTVSDLFNNKN